MHEARSTSYYGRVTFYSLLNLPLDGWPRDYLIYIYLYIVQFYAFDRTEEVEELQGHEKQMPV